MSLWNFDTGLCPYFSLLSLFLSLHVFSLSLCPPQLTSIIKRVMIGCPGFTSRLSLLVGPVCRADNRDLASDADSKNPPPAPTLPTSFSVHADKRVHNHNPGLPRSVGVEKEEKFWTFQSTVPIPQLGFELGDVPTKTVERCRRWCSDAADVVFLILHHCDIKTVNIETAAYTSTVTTRQFKHAQSWSLCFDSTDTCSLLPVNIPHIVFRLYLTGWRRLFLRIFDSLPTEKQIPGAGTDSTRDMFSPTCGRIYNVTVTSSPGAIRCYIKVVVTPSDSAAGRLISRGWRVGEETRGSYLSAVLDKVLAWVQLTGGLSSFRCSDLVFALVYTVILFGLVLGCFFRSILSW